MMVLLNAVPISMGMAAENSAVPSIVVRTRFAKTENARTVQAEIWSMTRIIAASVVMRVQMKTALLSALRVCAKWSVTLVSVIVTMTHLRAARPM